MNIEEHIWKLAAKKLAKEASNEESNELDELLSQYPDIRKNIELLFEWWDSSPEQTIEPGSHLLFKKILERIKGSNQAENTGEDSSHDQPGKK